MADLCLLKLTSRPMMCAHNLRSSAEVRGIGGSLEKDGPKPRTRIQEVKKVLHLRLKYKIQSVEGEGEPFVVPLKLVPLRSCHANSKLYESVNKQFHDKHFHLFVVAMFSPP